MTQAIAYLGFNGNCAEAMRFYEKALGGKIEMMMTGAQSPIADQLPKEFGDRVMHACLVLPGGGTIYAGDCPGNMPYEGIKGVSIAIDYPTVEEAERIFNTLAEGGQVTMPLAETFWAGRFGMCVDRFGTPWIVNGAPKKL
jgi:PhnB protein